MKDAQVSVQRVSDQHSVPRQQLQEFTLNVLQTRGDGLQDRASDARKPAAHTHTLKTQIHFKRNCSVCVCVCTWCSS